MVSNAVLGHYPDRGLYAPAALTEHVYSGAITPG